MATKKRREYIWELRRHLSKPQGQAEIDLNLVEDLTFAALWGLPAAPSVQIALACVCRYLEVFRIREPRNGEPARVATAVREWLGGASWEEMVAEGMFGLHQKRPVPEVQPAYLNRDRDFLKAVETLRLIIASPPTEPTLRAAMVEAVAVSCIEQWQENVWAADDPAAYVAGRDHWQVVELAMTERDVPAQRLASARTAALEGFLKGRWMENNAAARAVARREWQFVASQLHEVRDLSPDIEAAELEAERDRVHGAGGWEELVKRGGVEGAVPHREPSPPAGAETTPRDSQEAT